MSKFILTGFGDEIAPNLSDELPVMKQNEIRFIELRTVNGKGIDSLTPAEAKETKKQLDEAGFGVSSIGSSVGKVGIRDNFENHLDLFRNTLEVAATMQTKFIRIFSFYIPKHEKPETFRGEVMEKLSRICELAEGTGIRLLSENELDIYGDTPERCLDIIKSVGYEKIGQVFDIANFINLIERVEIYPYAWHLLKPYVEYLHIKDAVHIDDPFANHYEVRPSGYGEGHISEILSELAEGGFEGFLSVEPHLGYFPGYEALQKRMVPASMPDGGPQTFTVAASALKAVIRQIKHNVLPEA